MNEGAKPAYWLNRPYTVDHMLALAKLIKVEMTAKQAELFLIGMNFLMQGPLSQCPQLEALQYTIITD